MLTQSFVNCADVSNEEFQISPHLWQSCKEGAVLRRHANNKGCAWQQFLCCQSKVSGRCFGVIWRRGVSCFAFNAGKFALTLMLLWYAKPTSKPSFCRIRFKVQTTYTMHFLRWWRRDCRQVPVVCSQRMQCILSHGTACFLALDNHNVNMTWASADTAASCGIKCNTTCSAGSSHIICLQHVLPHLVWTAYTRFI